MTDQQTPRKSDKNWPKGEFAWHEVIQFYWWIIPILLAIGVAVLLPAIVKPKSGEQGQVIVYCAQDQTYAEPILRDFEAETGIRVRAVYDSEAVKTVGLANRLLAERAHPRCDVFWGNEEMRTRQLEVLDVWRETNGFSSFGARVRCLVVGTNELQMPLPTSLLELTNERWRGKVAMAFPQFGTTATHFHVLRQHWGEELWLEWCRGLVANDTLILDGNSTVVKMVARGQALIGLTDTDDVAAAQREGLNVKRGPELPGTRLFIPNTVAIVRGAPHPNNAQRLSDYLQQPAVSDRLLETGAITLASIPVDDQPRLKPDWQPLLDELESTTETLNGIFLR